MRKLQRYKGYKVTIFCNYATLLTLLTLLFGCASPQQRQQHSAQINALRTMKPIAPDPKNAVRPIKRPDSDLIRALENMQPLGVIWSFPKPSIEFVKAPPETPWKDREAIIWIKETITF